MKWAKCTVYLKKGMNFQFGEAAVFVSASDQPLSAIGIQMPDDLFEDLMHSVRVEDLVVKRNGQVTIYGSKKNICIKTQDYRVVDLRMPRIHFNKRSIAKTKLYDCLNAFDFTQIIGLCVNDKTRYHIGQLIHSRLLLNDLSEHIAFFIGRGLGLTPSGDDMLAGFTMALKAFCEDQNWSITLKKSLMKRETTFVSLAYYKALFNDHLSENFIKLIGLLEISDTDEINRTIKEVQAYGHTSGNDTLFGFLLGLKYLLSS